MPSEAPAPWLHAPVQSDPMPIAGNCDYPALKSGFGASTLQVQIDALVRSAVLPRLGLAFATNSDAPHAAVMPVTSLSAALLEPEIDHAADLVETARRQGSGPDAISDRLLVPASRLLSAEHDCGGCDDAAFALGQARLAMLLQQLPRPPHARRTGAAPTALVMLAASAHEGLESALVLRRFDQAGWTTRACGRQAGEAVEHLVHASWCSVIWIGVERATPIAQLGGMIRALRRSSLNPTIGIVCGLQGSETRGRKLRAVRIGADAVAETPAAALPMAETILRLTRRMH